MEARAVSRYIRISPRKARLVADLIRGKSVDEALGILALTPKKASPILRKAILSAAANVQFNRTTATRAIDELRSSSSRRSGSTRARRSSGSVRGPRAGRSASTSGRATSR